MNKLISFFILLFFLNACAKPASVQVIQPNDEKLNCEELENEIAESQKIKEDAEFTKDSGGNMARIILFWPAWAQSLHNADVAIQTANDRNHHLIKIMKQKKCKNINNIQTITSRTPSLENSIAGQLKILKDLYDSGDLTKEEYKKAKNKILN
tara:strand:- start:310 stop:768 length:459 start_codon:yes stop_codon:yes gene_type:complete